MRLLRTLLPLTGSLGGIDRLLDEAYRVHGPGSNEPRFGVTLGVKIES